MSVATVKERPILFSDPMVKAILGQKLHHLKTKTRRVIKPEYLGLLGLANLDLADPDDLATAIARCPYGQPGDRLWVREAWSPDHAHFYPFYPLIFRADGYNPAEHCDRSPDRPGQILADNGWHDFAWRPSIHMPRSYSRITLEIVSIKIECLQSITEEDAIAEGMEHNCHKWNYPANLPKCPACGIGELCRARNEFIHAGLGEIDDGVTAREAFQYLWDVINGPRGFGWDTNPYVWVIEFRRIKP